MGVSQPTMSVPVRGIRLMKRSNAKRYAISSR
jgi:hypothetical protein